MKTNRKNTLGIIALAVACVMLGSGLTLGLTSTSAAQAENTVVVTSPFTAAIADVKDSVVGVNNYQTVRYSNNYGNWGSWGDFFGFGRGFGGYGDYGNGGNQQPSTQEVLAGTGSGVVIADGYVLTNNHVVDGASSLKIAVLAEDSSTKEIDGVLVTSDANLDIAIIYAPELDIKPVVLGDSDTLTVGDWAICIGNPLGNNFYGTVTTGIVSALNRAVSSSSYDRYGRKETTTNTMIQTDAAINNGNSGGGMFNVNGELMGIPTMKYSGSAFSGASIEGIGMCIPINAAKPLINDVLSGKVATPEVASDMQSGDNASANNTLVGKPRLGVTVTSMNTNSTAILSGALPNGVYVTAVDPNGPADKAGMQADDIIVDVDGTVITGVTQMTSIIAEHKEGDVLNIKVYRVPGLAEAKDTIPDGEYVDLQVTLAVVDEVKQ